MMHHTILTCHVKKDWVDYNQHMNDAAYARVFSLAVEKLMNKIGIDQSFRHTYEYSIFTLETHICYLKEAREGESLRITFQLLDHDEKRLHVFFTMYNKDSEEVATSEQMLMGMDMKQGRPSPFPSPIAQKTEDMANKQTDLPYPKRAGRQIGIRQK